MRELYRSEEMLARLQMSEFFLGHFKFSHKPPLMFRDMLSVSFMYNLYKQQFPNSILGYADIELWFVQSGLVTSDGVSIKVREWDSLIEPVQNQLLAYMHIKSALAYGTKASLLTLQENVNSVRRFAQLFLIKKREAKASFKDLYELYVSTCDRADIPVTKKRLSVELSKIGFIIRKGYMNGQSGVTYICCSMPNEYELSLEHGIGVFSEQRAINAESRLSYFDNTKRTLYFGDHPKSDETLKYIEERRNVWYESPTTSKAEEAQKIDNWGEKKGTLTDVQRGTQESSPKANNRDSGRRSETTKESSTPWCAEDDIAVSDSVAATKGSNTQRTSSRRDFAAETSLDDDAGFEADVEGLIADDSASVDEGDDDELEQTEEEIKAEVFAALKFAYRLHPDKFDKEEMQSYLDTMDVVFTSEDLWEDFMSFVKR